MKFINCIPVFCRKTLLPIHNMVRNKIWFRNSTTAKRSHVDWFTKACRWHYLRSKTPQAHKSIRPPSTPQKPNPNIPTKRGGKKRRRRKLQTLQTSYMLTIFSKSRSHRKIIIFLSLLSLFLSFIYLFLF